VVTIHLKPLGFFLGQVGITNRWAMLTGGMCLFSIRTLVRGQLPTIGVLKNVDPVLRIELDLAVLTG